MRTSIGCFHHPSGDLSDLSSSRTIQGYVGFERREKRRPLKSFRRQAEQTIQHTAVALFRARFTLDFHGDRLVVAVVIVLTDLPRDSTS